MPPGTLRFRLRGSRAARRARVAWVRLNHALRQDLKTVRQTTRWLVVSREYTNFTYDLTPVNKEHLAWFVSAISATPVDQVRGFIEEISTDLALRKVLRDALERSAGLSGIDLEARFGRRIGWYAFVRACKPRLVVETGVDQGLGTMALAAGLHRNYAEGHPGRLVAVDINRAAGRLVAPPYNKLIDLRIGNSLDVIPSLTAVDLFIHDSDHSAEHERRELDLIEPALTDGAVVLSDNAHASVELASFAERTGRGFLFFDERPADHWYPGAGIGAAYSGVSNRILRS
jgi:predicted O-methyltransferase YrrM